MTYDADPRLQVSRQVESREEPLVPAVGEVHLIQLQDGRRQLLKVVWKPVEQPVSQSKSSSQRWSPVQASSYRRTTSASFSMGFSSGLQGQRTGVLRYR